MAASDDELLRWLAPFLGGSDTRRAEGCVRSTLLG
jgi:hypothetical protein